MSAIKEGFYKVQFHAALPGAGGIVIVNGNTVRGGDSQYLYSGVFSDEPSRLSANITVSALSSQARSVFDTLGGKFELNVVGNVTGGAFQLSGASPVPGTPDIRIRGVWIAGLEL